MSEVPPRPWRIVHSEASLGWGGQEHRVLTELLAFHQRGCPVGLLAPAASEVFRRAGASGLPVEAVGEPGEKFPVTVWRALRWLRRFRPDVVNTHSSRDGWRVGLAARLARVPLLIRSRHIDVDYPQAWLSRHAFTTFADHVLTTSDQITTKFQTLFGLPPERITTVPTGIDLERFCPEGPRAVLPEATCAVGAPRIGMVSVLRSWKGHPCFFAAAKALVQADVRAQFVVVGGGGGEAYVAAAAQQHGVTERTVFTGHREDVPEILRALDVLVIPSTRHEGVPQIGLQALACGTPVVGSDVGGIPEIIRPGTTGRIFPAEDAAALAAKIRETLEHTEETRRLSAAGRALVTAEHSLPAMVAKLGKIYARHLPQR